MLYFMKQWSAFAILEFTNSAESGILKKLSLNIFNVYEYGALGLTAIEQCLPAVKQVPNIPAQRQASATHCTGLDAKHGLQPRLRKIT